MVQNSIAIFILNHDYGVTKYYRRLAAEENGFVISLSLSEIVSDINFENCLAISNQDTVQELQV